MPQPRARPAGRDTLMSSRPPPMNERTSSAKRLRMDLSRRSRSAGGGGLVAGQAEEPVRLGDALDRRRCSGQHNSSAGPATSSRGRRSARSRRSTHRRRSAGRGRRWRRMPATVVRPPDGGGDRRSSAGSRRTTRRADRRGRRNAGVGVDEHIRRQTGGFGGEDVLQGVVVGAAEEATSSPARRRALA